MSINKNFIFIAFFRIHRIKVKVNDWPRNTKALIIIIWKNKKNVWLPQNSPKLSNSVEMLLLLYGSECTSKKSHSRLWIWVKKFPPEAIHQTVSSLTSSNAHATRGAEKFSITNQSELPLNWFVVDEIWKVTHGCWYWILRMSKYNIVFDMLIYAAYISATFKRKFHNTLFNK